MNFQSRSNPIDTGWAVAAVAVHDSKFVPSMRMVTEEATSVRAPKVSGRGEDRLHGSRGISVHSRFQNPKYRDYSLRMETDAACSPCNGRRRSS